MPTGPICDLKPVVKTRKQRFPGLRLSASDERTLDAMTRGRTKLSLRKWRRIQILRLLHDGWILGDAARAVGTFPREVRRVGWRYIDRGLGAALSDDPRPKPSKMLDKRQEAAIVAMACSDPPEGRSRWTTALLAHEAIKRGVVPTVSRETIRRTLRGHDLKPWREKNVVRAEARRRIRREDGGRAEHLEQAAGSERASGRAG